MKKKHVLILFTVLALSVTSVMKLVPVSKVAASSILGGNKNERYSNLCQLRCRAPDQQDV